jgi:membrane protein
MAIAGLGGLPPLEVLKRAIQDFSADSMTTYAAALAYRIVFSLFPFLLFLVALLAFLQIPQLFEWMREQAALLVPGEAMAQVNNVIEELQTPRGGLVSVGIVLALWSASVGVMSLIEALNVAYDVPERRPTWRLYLLSLLYTVGLAILMIAAAALMVLGPQAASWAASRLGLDEVFVVVWNWLRWPLAVLLLMLAVSVVYYVGPNIRQRFRFITPGAILSVVVWIVASVAFGIYVQNFADYSATYGSIGAVVILMFYFYLSAAVLLFGAEINAVIRNHSEGHPDQPPANRRDTRP